VSCPRAQAAAETPQFLTEPLWEYKTARTGTSKDTPHLLKDCKSRRQSTEKHLPFFYVSHTRIRAQFIPLDKITNKTSRHFSLIYIARTHTVYSISCLCAVGRYLPWRRLACFWSPEWPSYARLACHPGFQVD